MPQPSPERIPRRRHPRRPDQGSQDDDGQIAKDFGVHEGTMNKWFRQADIDAGNKPGNTSDESAELREMRRRNRLFKRGERGHAPCCRVFVAGESC